MIPRLLWLAAALAGVALSAAAAPDAVGYRLTLTAPLGAPDRWDYVVYDPATRRVYVAHGDRLSVVDGRDGRIVGAVEGIAGGTHGTAVSAATGQGFTDDGKAGVAVAFDLKTLKVLKRIAAQPDADGVIADPATGRIFVIDGDSGKVTAIDPKTDQPLADIDLGGKLEAAAAGRDGRLYVNGAEKREVVVVDTRANAILKRYPMPSCASPHGIAVNGADHRLFVTCVNSQMLVLDSETGAVVATLPIGRGSDSAAWDPKRKLAFSADGLSGVISVVRQEEPDRYVALPPIPTALSARTMAIDPVTGRLFVAGLDLQAPATPGARPTPMPGTLRLMIFDPAP